MAEGKGLKSILIDNKSNHAVTLFIFPNWHKLRWLSFSKIVKPDNIFLYQTETAFQFELRARPEGKKMKSICSGRMWEKDMLLGVSGYHEIHVKEEELTECKEKQICIRRQNMTKEVSASGSKNLYEILKLNMKEVREKPHEEQYQIIKRAYHSQLRLWHPDRNPENGNTVICQEIIAAYNILIDPEARATYNNVADFDKGLFSIARYKAIFTPECYSTEQKKQYGKRIGLFCLSTLLTGVGIGLTFLTAGMAAPVALGLVAASGALMGGGISSALRTINREAIAKGCSFKEYFKRLAIGAVGGAAMGVGVAGIAMFLGGATKLAFKAAQLSLERQISMRITTSAFRGLITSLTNNIGAIVADGPKMSWKQVILHVLLNAWLGGIGGLPGGLAENMIQDVVSVERALISLETASFNTGNAIEETTNVVVETFANFVKERVDDDVENKSILDHIKSGAKRAGMAVAKHLGKALTKVVKKQVSDFSNQNEASDDISEETNDNKTECTGIFPFGSSVEPDKSEKTEANDNDDCTERVEHRLKYISDGCWFSKMLVDYEENGETKHHEVKDSESSITIPSEATNIKVRFQVMRFLGTWCDVKKYDRFKKCWIKPNQPHTLEYNTPVSRTYILSGNLYYEAVMKITGECYDNINEI